MKYGTSGNNENNCPQSGDKTVSISKNPAKSPQRLSQALRDNLKRRKAGLRKEEKEQVSS